MFLFYNAFFHSELLLAIKLFVVCHYSLLVVHYSLLRAFLHNELLLILKFLVERHFHLTKNKLLIYWLLQNSFKHVLL